MTSSNQIIRCMSPLLMKDLLTISFSMPPKFKRYNKLVRGIVEDVSPPISRERLLNGTPYQLIRPSNFIQFSPLPLEYMKKLIRKVSQVLFHNTILMDTSLTHNPAEWYATVLNNQEMKDLITFSTMKTKFLYKEDAFKKFLLDAQTDGFSFYDQLGNILSLELTLRKVNLKER